MKEPSYANSDKRIIWLDLVKFIAIFMMIAVHCTDNVTPAERSEPWYNLWGSFYGSFMRPAIPLFVMVTGALLLPVRENLSTFYGKRLTRIVVPFLIWSVLYNLFPWITGLLGLSPTVINDFFAWAVTNRHQRFLCLGRTRSVIFRSLASHSDDSFQLLSPGGSDVVCLSSYRFISLHAYILCLGPTSLCPGTKILPVAVVCFSLHSLSERISHKRPVGNLFME